eukprot:TRINITY_DN316_c0_g1_i10.p1 TRINITY_DN316_c0_g1~~TRINITY_DN316_c0_g1_i10.p1  ORF type:complete len:383 (-),score=121.81 TRINITY_DN316_c0_g1_i10:76-1224(-)
MQRNANNEKLAEAVNCFGWQVLGKLARGKHENTFISPLSIAQIMSLVAGGAAGETLAAMKKVLHVSGHDAAQLAELYAGFNRSLHTADAEVIIANSTWTRPDLKLLPAFQSLAAKYGAEAMELPQQPAPINAWCAKNTKNRITSIIDSLEEDLALVLINALYFKGLFTKPFDIKLTEAHDFTNADGKKHKVQMMMLDKKMDYQEDTSMQAVMLDYGKKPVGNQAGASICCVVALPKSTNTVDDLLASGWNNVVSTRGFSNCNGVLQLPRFRAEATLQLGPVLEQLGMQVAFSEHADFTALCQPPNVKISQVVHKTFLEVNEKGTEAAAVTAVSVALCCVVREDPPFHMCVDRPFLFALLEKTTGALLFAGKIAAPVDAPAPQ